MRLPGGSSRWEWVGGEIGCVRAQIPALRSPHPTPFLGSHSQALYLGQAPWWSGEIRPSWEQLVLGGSLGILGISLFDYKGSLSTPPTPDTQKTPPLPCPSQSPVDHPLYTPQPRENRDLFLECKEKVGRSAEFLCPLPGEVQREPASSRACILCDFPSQPGSRENLAMLF